MSGYSYYYMRFPEGRSKTLTYSYDDGVETDIRFMEILDKYNTMEEIYSLIEDYVAKHLKT